MAVRNGMSVNTCIPAVWGRCELQPFGGMSRMLGKVCASTLWRHVSHAHLLLGAVKEESMHGRKREKELDNWQRLKLQTIGNATLGKRRTHRCCTRDAPAQRPFPCLRQSLP
jgi:hypothetical protein